MPKSGNWKISLHTLADTVGHVVLLKKGGWAAGTEKCARTRVIPLLSGGLATRIILGKKSSSHLKRASLFQTFHAFTLLKMKPTDIKLMFI